MFLNRLLVSLPSTTRRAPTTAAASLLLKNAISLRSFSLISTGRSTSTSSSRPLTSLVQRRRFSDDTKANAESASAAAEGGKGDDQPAAAAENAGGGEAAAAAAEGDAAEGDAAGGEPAVEETRAVRYTKGFKHKKKYRIRYRMQSTVLNPENREDRFLHLEKMFGAELVLQKYFRHTYGDMKFQAFKNMKKKARRMRGHRLLNFFRLLEGQLCVFLARAGLAKNITTAKILIETRKVLMNGHTKHYASEQVKPGTVVSIIADKSTIENYVVGSGLEGFSQNYIESNLKCLSAVLLRQPHFGEVMRSWNESILERKYFARVITRWR